MINNRSELLSDLFAAMAKAQAEIEIAGHNATNPHFRSKFADLTEIIRVSRPALTKHGLSVMQILETEIDGMPYLCTLLSHSSGQFIQSKIRISPDKADIQSLGKYITYLKRYSYAALVGVVSSAEDDDGESLMQESRTPATNGYAPRPLPGEKIIKEQLEWLEYNLKDHPDIVSSIMDKYKISSLRDVPKADFIVISNRVRDIIRAKE